MRQRVFLLSTYCLLLAAFMLSCHSPLQSYQTERFDLTAGPCAAQGYPMEVVEGRFLSSDGKGFVVSPDFLEGDWGSSSTTYVSGDGTSPTPDSLKLRWFSYTEDKFYEGHWLLPQRRIYDLLKQGYWNTDPDRNRHETYDSFTVCMLPKGVVVVWLTGQNQIFLGRYQGQEVAFDFKRFNSAANRPRMIQQEQAKLPVAVQQQIRTGTLSTKPWDDYLKTYSWKIGFKQPLKLYNYGAGYLNGEEENYPLTKEVVPFLERITAPSLKSAPANLYLWVDAGYGRKRQIQVRAFSEAETLAAFQALATSTSPLTLYFDTDEGVTSARLFLQSDKQRIELTKAKVELYDAE